MTAELPSRRMSGEVTTAPGRATTRFSYRGHQLPDDDIAGLPDHLICKDNASGDLTARRHTERFVPVPRKASE